VQREQSGHTSRLHSKIARVIELTKLLRRLPTLLILALSAFYPGVSWTHLEAQNVEGQIVASQFGEFQVPGIDTGSLQFEPTACQVSGGGKNFAAFTVGVPIKIVDSNPNLTEVQTPAAVFINQCAVSMGTTYIHSTPFYLTSGTGGLQEALTNGPVKAGGPNTVILNADWYALVAPSNPATVIASVNGSTALGLVDVTTTPYTAYQWNGTAYAEVSYGGNLPSGSGMLKVTSGTGGLATPGADFLSPSITNGMLPQGTAITGTNYNSNQFQLQGNYCTGSSPCNPAGDFWGIQGLLTSGPNPYSTLIFSHSGTTGGASVNFGAIVNLSEGAYIPITVPTGNNSTSVATTANTFNNMPAVSAAYFGAYGDAYGPPDGCSTTASSTTVTCPDAPFVSTDVGKQVWVHGAGAAGVAFHATINSVTSNTAVVVNTAASTSVAQAPGNAVYGHDDTTAVQACFQYSATNAVQCALRALPAPGGGTGGTGFLIGSGGLQLVPDNTDLESSATSVIGANPINGTNLFCEYNGDCLSLAAGPIQGAIVSNLGLTGDPSQPNGRGIHLNAAAGSYNTGGLWNSTFTNILVSNFAQECMWMDGGGGEGYQYNLPNQIDTFNQFQCDGPNQSHPANLIKMTGQAAQILFQNGQVNGNGYSGGSSSFYPNPLIAIEEKTTGLSDTPVDVKFYGYTYEVGTQGLYVGEGGYNIHFDNGYVENVSSPLIAQRASGLTFSGNHIANSGNTTAIAQFEGGVTGGMRDNFEYGGGVTVAALAVCTGSGNTVDFSGNASNVMTTTDCATSTASSPSSSTLTVNGGQTVSVGTSEIITTISAPGINPGKTLTLYASGSGIALATGGNINLGPYSSPMGVPPGGTITLTLFDQGTTWTVTGATPTPAIACNAPTMTYRWTPAAACSTSQPCATDQVAGNNASQTTSGDLPTYSATGGPDGTPALVFNGTSDYLAMTTPIASGLTSFTMYAIFKPAGVPSGGHNYDFFGGTNNSIEFGIDPSGDNAFLNQQDIIGVAGNATFPSGTWYTEVVTYNNGTTTTALYKANGGALTSDGGSTSQAMSFSATTPYLGGQTLTSSYFNGSIAEWGFLSGSANPAGIAQWSSCHYGI
jgi:hypothetical protein